jgi:hypothetical protein
MNARQIDKFKLLAWTLSHSDHVARLVDDVANDRLLIRLRDGRTVAVRALADGSYAIQSPMLSGKHETLGAALDALQGALATETPAETDKEAA